MYSFTVVYAYSKSYHSPPLQADDHPASALNKSDTSSSHSASPGTHPVHTSH